MDFLYGVLSSVARLAAGEKIFSIFTFQKSLLNVLGFDWVKGGIGLKYVPSFVKYFLYPLGYTMFEYGVAIITIKSVVGGGVRNPFNEKVKGVIVSMTFVASATKLAYIRIRKIEFTRLMTMIVDIKNVRSDDRYVLNAQRNTVHYALLLLATAGTWTLYVIIRENDLPFPSDFPWSYSPEDNLIGWLSVDFISALYCALGHILIETLFLVSVGVICSSASVLKKNLRRLGSVKNNDDKVMREAIKLHVTLLRAYQQVVKCYRSLFIIQTAYTITHACVCIFSMVKATDKVAVTLNSMPMLTSAYVQLFVYCYYGQMLTSTFNDLPFAAYNNKWIDCSLPVKQSLYLFEMVSSRNVALKGYGDSSASFKTYLSSFRESVSYFLVLKTVTGVDVD